MSETITLYDYTDGSTEVGIGDEVVIVDGHNNYLIENIVAITKATIKTESKTFAKKSKKEYGSGGSWRYARISGMNPNKVREIIEHKKKKDMLRRFFLDVRDRMNNESQNLKMEDLVKIVAILDEAKERSPND